MLDGGVLIVEPSWPPASSVRATFFTMLDEGVVVDTREDELEAKVLDPNRFTSRIDVELGQRDLRLPLAMLPVGVFASCVT